MTPALHKIWCDEETPGKFVALAPGDGEHGNPPGEQFGGDGLSQAAGMSCQDGFHDRFPLNGEFGRILRLNRPNATVGGKKTAKIEIPRRAGNMACSTVMRCLLHLGGANAKARSNVGSVRRAC